MFNFGNSWVFNVFKRGDDYFAIFMSANSQNEMHHYRDQGYAFWGPVNASNASLAVEFARQQDSSTISTLEAKIREHELEIQKLSNEVLQARAKQQATFSSPFDVDPLTILGLAPGATTEEIKMRARILTKSFHSDRGGSDYLMSLVNDAKDRLKTR